MDHRYRTLFEGNKKEMAVISPEWYYGISTASMEAILRVNGFSLSFDGDSALNDCDLGARMSMSGYDKLAMFRDSYVVEAYAGTAWHLEKMRQTRPEVKCNWAMLLYNKAFMKTRANVGSINPDEIIKEVCNKRCGLVQKCREYYPHRAPFYNKTEQEFYQHWLKYGATEQIDLEVEREMRLSESDYQEGTFVNC